MPRIRAPTDQTDGVIGGNRLRRWRQGWVTTADATRRRVHTQRRLLARSEVLQIIPVTDRSATKSD